jgi:hypothetical protein
MLTAGMLRAIAVKREYPDNMHLRSEEHFLGEEFRY